MKSCFLAMTAMMVVLTSATTFAQNDKQTRLTADLKHLVGEWESVTKSGDTEAKGVYLVEWGPQKSCIIWKAEGRSVVTDQEVHACGIMGEDPREGILREQSFATDGSALTSQYKEIDPLVFKGRRQGTVSGKKTRAALTVTWAEDRSTFEWKATNYYLDDEKQEDLVITFRRK